VSAEEFILRTQALSKSFGGVTALAALDCDVRPGQIIGLLGPNGAGKTTTMKLLLGMLRPTRGHAEVLGYDVTRDAIEVKRRVGYTPDEPSFYDFLSGRETLEFVIQVRDSDRESSFARLEPLIDALDFRGELDRMVGSYSHGNKKKLALLIALAHAPRLLLLDEPTNGLDPPAAASVRKLLRAEAERGAAVVISTHLLDMADRTCDEVLLLNRGALVFRGPPRAARSEAGLTPDASLEEAFLTLVGRR
jgi:ABC-2 type transport system ATP-binding protein